MGQQIERVRGTLKDDGKTVLEDVEFVVVVTSNGLERWQATLTLDGNSGVEFDSYELQLVDGRVGRMSTKQIKPGSPWVFLFQGTGPLEKPE